MLQIIDDRIRRICLYGGPSAGKSTIAAEIFAALKRSAEFGTPELVREYVKNWAWDKRNVRGSDQLYLLSKQLHAEEVPLRGGADIIVTDSPIFLSYTYSLQNRSFPSSALLDLVKYFDSQYKPLHIFIDRGSKSYDEKGRYHTVEAALDLDLIVKEKLAEVYGPAGFITLDFAQFPQTGCRVVEDLLREAPSVS